MRSVFKKWKSVLVAIAALVGCRGDGTLLDLYPMVPIINPETRVLITDNQIVHARLDARQQIKGITGNGGFVTTNRFRSFDFESYPWQGNQGLVKFRGDRIVQVVADGTPFTIRYSGDYGKSWEPQAGASVVDGELGWGNIDVMDIVIKPDLTVLLLTRQRRLDVEWLSVYHVDVEAKSSRSLFSKSGATPRVMDFADGDTGWLLYAEAGTGEAKLLKTLDGGESWSEGGVPHVDSALIVALGVDKLLVYNQAGQVFHSGDGGLSFEAGSIGGAGVGLSMFHSVSGGVSYALFTGGGIAKSTDGGKTWLTMETQVHGVEVSGTALHFHNEQQGIVYGADRMFITDDGGESWAILIYPYDYIFE